MYKFKDIIDIDKFEGIQYDISNATGLAIITVDYKGKPVTSHSGCSEFCNMVRKDEDLNQQCMKCDSRGGLEAARTGKPFIYRCHMGIIDLAVPIMVDDQYLGALMAGQVLTEASALEDLETIGPSDMDIRNHEKYLKAYNKLPFIPFSKIQSIAQMMFHINNHIVNEAVSKFQEKMLYEQNIRMIEKQKVQPELKSGGMKSSIPQEKRYINKILEPALAYIEENYEENISLKKIADISNVSSFYFSKLFKKEMGMNFSAYFTECKMNKAKEMLKNTDMLIANIASKLGYYECGYFTKVFKKSEGITPSEYRNLSK
jgi:ligand-binding sensor protein/AraC-like DNA-binding protein